MNDRESATSSPLVRVEDDLMHLDADAAVGLGLQLDGSTRLEIAANWRRQ